MPWKETYKMDEKLKFVIRKDSGDKMSDLCREFGISRKTGYKIYNRYQVSGLMGVDEHSRRPVKLANLLDSGIAAVILNFKKAKPTWGAPKLRELIIRKYSNINPPAISTIHALLDRNGFVKHRNSHRRFKARGTYLSKPSAPNHLWCTDFKGQFYLGNQSLCYPLTITDQVSRYILSIEAMDSISENKVIAEFKQVFQEYGLPDGIRSDNGVPFASNGLFGLSRLSVYWLRVGIKLERIKPGKPYQNGTHERMHRTLKLSTAKPSAKNLLLQQEKFDSFKKEFNDERPHEALNMRSPAEVYKNSSKVCPDILEDLAYPYHDQSVRVSRCGSIRLPHQQKIFISEVLGGQFLGLKQLSEELWSVSFMDYEIGYFDTKSYKFTPATNPFSTKDLMSVSNNINSKNQ